METIDTMAQVKIEEQDRPLDMLSEELPALADKKDWDAHMELTFLTAVARSKPVGIHKHIRILSIQRQVNQVSPRPYSIAEIWDRLGDYYGMDALEELDEEDEEDEEEERAEKEKEKGNSGLHEFSLPLDEYEQLISEHRQEDAAVDESVSPSPPPAKRTRTKRETSPTSSSATPTPEPEEGKTSRRSARRKTEQKSGRAPASKTKRTARRR